MRQSRDFEEFYQANYVRLVVILLAVLGDRAEAEDAAQEAFSRALVRWPAVSRYDLPEMWVRKVGLRLAIDAGRRWRRRLDTSARLLAQRRPAVAELSDDLPFTPVGHALMRLPQRDREVLVMRYVADMTVAEIAAERGVPAGTVRDRLAAGRRRLERELADGQAADAQETRDGR